MGKEYDGFLRMPQTPTLPCGIPGRDYEPTLKEIYMRFNKKNFVDYCSFARGGLEVVRI